MPLAVGLLTGIASRILSGDMDEEEERQVRAALEEYASIAPPEERRLIAQTIPRSRMSDLRRDPGLSAVQDEALARTMEIARSGESAQAQADYERSAMQSAQLDRSNRQALVSEAEARGMGPEAAYTDLLLAGQAGADRERMAGLDRAASASEMAYRALADGNHMAASRSATEWDQDAEVAAAEDDLARWTANTNNQFAMYNRDDEYRRLQAQLQIAGAKNQARRGVAEWARDQRDQIRGDVANVGRGLQEGLATATMGIGNMGGAGGMMPKPTAPTAPMAPKPTAPAPQQKMVLPETDPRKRRIR
jgi:hypothetical protein